MAAEAAAVSESNESINKTNDFNVMEIIDNNEDIPTLIRMLMNTEITSNALLNTLRVLRQRFTQADRSPPCEPLLEEGVMPRLLGLLSEVFCTFIPETLISQSDDKYILLEILWILSTCDSSLVFKSNS